ncbi:hypothetical protein [Mycoplasma sp. 480]|uniref:hypothetical protein n=1 Tax=Mycoplasma sp. 480 TaxID=3440155 RepID=UPI003F51984D
MKRNIKVVAKIDTSLQECAILAFEEIKNEKVLIFNEKNLLQKEVFDFYRDAMQSLNKKIKTNIKKIFISLSDNFLFETNLYSVETEILNHKKTITSEEINRNLTQAKQNNLISNHTFISIIPQEYKTYKNGILIYEGNEKPLLKNADSIEIKYSFTFLENNLYQEINNLFSQLNLEIESFFTELISLDRLINLDLNNQDSKKIIINLNSSNTKISVIEQGHIKQIKDIASSFADINKIVAKELNLEKNQVDELVNIYGDSLSIIKPSTSLIKNKLTVLEFKTVLEKHYNKIAELVVNEIKNIENYSEFAIFLNKKEEQNTIFLSLIEQKINKKIIIFNSKFHPLISKDAKEILEGIKYIEKSYNNIDLSKSEHFLINTQPYSTDELIFKGNKFLNFLNKLLTKRIKHA